MQFKEIIAPTMKELFIQEITGRILSGELKIGDKLPTEREMERQMKVSRTIINSALAELSRIGFIKILPRQGVFIGDYIRNGSIETLTAIMNFNGGKLDQKTLYSLMEYRTQTECICAELAAQNRTSEDLILLKEIQQAINAEPDTDKIAHLKVDFHHAIFCATGNNIYPLVYNSFKQLSTIFNEIVFRNTGTGSARAHLKVLIQAIEDKNSTEARRIVKLLSEERMVELKQFYFK